MIFDILFFIIGLFLQLLAAILSVVTFIIPQGITDAILEILGYPRLFGGILNLTAFYGALGALIQFFIYWYAYKLVLAAWGSMPFLGSKFTHPKG